MSEPRRQFLFQLLSKSFTLAMVLFAACRSKKPDEGTPTFTSCTDMSQVSEADVELRKSLAYQEISPIDESICGNCNLWLPPKGNVKCGGCTLFGGPVATDGYCTYWAPLTSSSGPAAMGSSVDHSKGAEKNHPSVGSGYIEVL